MFKIVVFALTFSASGCAIFEAGNVPKTTLAAPADLSVPKPTLSYSIVAMTGGLSSNKESSDSVKEDIEEDFHSVLQESAIFEGISGADEPSDIDLDFVLTGNSNAASLIPALITGLSFYTVPSWATIDYELVATAKSSDGLVRQYAVSDSYKLVQWLPMLFVYPFKSFQVVNDLRKNMVAKVLTDMGKDGFFSATDNTPATDSE
jgi:hypothetical protein